jgi:hypothetical protein
MAISLAQIHIVANFKVICAKLLLTKVDENISLPDFPKLDCFVICREDEICLVLLLQPFDLIDFFFDFQRLEIIKFRFMRLKCCVSKI